MRFDFEILAEGSPGVEVVRELRKKFSDMTIDVLGLPAFYIWIPHPCIGETLNAGAQPNVCHRETYDTVQFRRISRFGIKVTSIDSYSTLKCDG